MMHEQFRAALEACDVALVRKMWHHVSPNMPQPEDDEEALQRIHYARTLMDVIGFDRRAYSHAWLLERGLPSGLPDDLRPRAQRLYPVTVSAVGIAVRGSTAVGRQLAPLIRGVMSDAVNEAYADGRTEPAFVKARMMEAKERELGRLLGIRSLA